ncbi:hypothetical protein [Falsibacillus albus]|uniref:Uncharacterized protein n=1 Tax=Falsibacillus albus TaxID=2478915 RepID=A0A3L7JHK7_9BACI|nr:hypothetical protein [Falsibacillus albus]RLQ89954.1 hypothetical protein D9X91_22170 [Falsibacillus albus]
MAKLTLDQQIKKQQNIVWELAENCSSDQLRLKDRIFEHGLVVEESNCLKAIYDNDSDENKKDYLVVLNEMGKFYKKVMKSQEQVN